MRNWWKSCKQFWRLSNHEKTNFIRVGINLFTFWFLSKTLPFNKFMQAGSYLMRTRKSVNCDDNKVERIVNTIKKVSGHFAFCSTCLTQALTTKLMLRDVPNLVLTIGVSLENGFEAHAWVEKDGNYIIGEMPAKFFTPIWRFE